MKAARIAGYGLPVRIDEIPIPAPQSGELLIQVKAAAVNPVDWKIADGRFGAEGREMPLTLGCEIAGVVAAEAPGFQQGDRVFGYLNLIRNGGYAEYAIADPSEVTHIPGGLGFPQAAAIPVALCTAMDGLVTYGGLQAGHRVLILGGAGGVGSAAIQIAKRLGAFVYATASARNQDRLRELGTDAPIDYSSADPAAIARDVDLVFDTVGGDTAIAAVPSLRAGGRFVSPAFAQLPEGVDLRVYGIQPDGARLNAFPVETLKVFIDRELPLDLAAEALEYSRSGRARGKIVLIP